MSNDGFAEGHRVARLLAIAVPVAIFLLWWSLWDSRGDVVAVDLVEGVVVERDGKTCLIRAPNDENTRLLCPQGAAAETKVRLSRTRYESGELRYAYAPAASEAP